MLYCDKVKERKKFIRLLGVRARVNSRSTRSRCCTGCSWFVSSSTQHCWRGGGRHGRYSLCVVHSVYRHNISFLDIVTINLYLWHVSLTYSISSDLLLFFIRFIIDSARVNQKKKTSLSAIVYIVFGGGDKRVLSLRRHIIIIIIVLSPSSVP